MDKATCMKSFLFDIAFAVLLTGCATANNSPHVAAAPVIYHNAQYGLTFSLADDWRGYSVFTREWVGQKSDPKSGDIIYAQRGPEIVLRHPQWTASDPHQDIPIRVFTRSQWVDVHNEVVFLDAGGTTDEIGHNAKYVFGRSSRFNWGEETGWEEAGRIVATNCMANSPALYEH